MAQRWEYDTTEKTDRYSLDQLGAEGWELVTVVVYPDEGTKAWLKRPIADEPPPAADPFAGQRRPGDCP